MTKSTNLAPAYTPGGWRLGGVCRARARSQSRVVFCILLSTSALASADGVSEGLLTAISLQENRKSDVSAVGDRHLLDKSYGIYQIRRQYLEDVMRITDSDYVLKLWGKRTLTLRDIRDPVVSRWVVRRYLEYYGWVYEQRTGNVATDEVYARMHNGGPTGWKKSATQDYWYSVRDILHALRLAEWSKYQHERRMMRGGATDN